jgi:hypothetical protein
MYAIGTQTPTPTFTRLTAISCSLISGPPRTPYNNGIFQAEVSHEPHIEFDRI